MQVKLILIHTKYERRCSRTHFEKEKKINEGLRQLRNGPFEAGNKLILTANFDEILIRIIRIKHSTNYNIQPL